MKKLVALILVCMLCAATGYAAEWVEGRSASQPYAGVPEVKLDKTMGYIMLFPRTKMPAERFCDILEIYLPREDLALGEGSLTLFDENGEVAKLSFADADSVEMRLLEESELEGLMWGGGMCIEVHLPMSLRFDTAYYVLMDENKKAKDYLIGIEPVAGYWYAKEQEIDNVRIILNGILIGKDNVVVA